MSQPTVYLAGPIMGLDYAGAVDWRVQATAWLAPFGIKALSPMRGKDYLSDVKSFAGVGDNIGPFSTNRGIMTRDRFDATRCDVMLVNMVGAPKASIGTAMEIAWADYCRTPVVLVMEPKGNPHEHAMLLEAVGFRVETLHEAIEVVRGILG